MKRAPSHAAQGFLGIPSPCGKPSATPWHLGTR
ncbi:hypothetical protein HDG38_002592 [Paraburkholderia sp. WSM4177]|nr:hypothetical protein [Paraburkholderia sp. WSM4177]MBB5485558.1 hypothetical protein [Paraburkholderia sp. WSM4180]